MTSPALKECSMCCYGSLFVCVMVNTMSRADFAEVSNLSSRPEMPDPLVMLNGDKVASKEDWINKRRPELKKLFQHYMYGYFPPKPEKVTGKILHENKKAFGGKATLREIAVTFGPPKMP